MVSTTSLSKFKPASFSELFSISLPLMISALSGNAMFFIDRLILANYSLDSMNSAAAVGIVAYVFILGFMSITSIAEVFVGQHNGAQQYKKLSEPVWQMIWFALASIIVFWPIAIWGAHLVTPYTLESQGIPYFRWLMFFGPLIPITGALSAFFAGKGDPKIITYAAIIGNIINFGLDFLLIFGYREIIPAFGTTGAAMATVISQLIQVIILTSVFFNKHNRKKYHTLNYKFNKNVFLSCFKIGYPNAIGHVLEMAAHSAMFFIAASASLAHVTILTMGQNFFILFAFLTDGLQKGVIAIASNLIGSKQIDKIKTLIWSSIKLHTIIIAFTAIPLLLLPNILIHLFDIDEAVNLVGPSIIQQTTITFRFVWLYIIFDGFVWIIAGILTSGGDTKFIMITNALCAWLFYLCPLYIAINYFHSKAQYMWLYVVFYAIINFTLFTFRLKQGKWKQQVIEKN